MRILYRANVGNEFIFQLNVTAGQSVVLPLINGKTYDFVVIWGDGTANGKVTSYNDPDAVHTYSSGGNYVVRIKGICQAFVTNNTAAIRASITKIINWGTDADFRNLDFWGCSNLTSIPYDGNGMTAVTGASNITTFDHFLHGCTSVSQTLNDRLFSLCPGVNSFSSTFESSGVTGSIPANIFKHNTQATVFYRTFYASGVTGSIPSGLFYYTTMGQNFQETFGYTGISGNIPSVLFSYCGTNATIFKGTFRNTNLGNGGESLPADIYDTNTQAVDFSYNLYSTKFTCTIPLLFQFCSQVNSYAYTFGATPWSGVIQSELFKISASSVLSFEGTFLSTNITGIPKTLFYYNTEATTFHGCFSTCYSLTKSNGGLGYDIFNNELFAQNTKVKKMSQVFWDDSNIQMALPEDMFWTNTEIDDMWGCFAKVTIEGPIPKKFHWYMPKLTSLSYTYYQGGWGNYTLNGDVDPDLFIYNPELSEVSWLFRWRHGIGKVPNGLFRNNKKIVNFLRTFECAFAYLEQYVFSESGDSSAYERFEGFTPIFTNCFNGGSFGTMQINVVPATDWAPNDIITGQSSAATCVILSKYSNTIYYVHSLTGVFTSGEIIGVTGNPSKLADQNTGAPSFGGWFNTRYAQELWNPSKYNIYSVQCETRQRPSSLWAAGDVIVGLTSGATFTMVTDQTNTRWTFNVKGLTGTFQNGETMGVAGNPSKQVVINTTYLWFTFNGHILNLDVPPASDWVRDDIITGQSSGATCRIHAKISATSYYIRDVVGTFTEGEVIGVTGDLNKLVDLGTGYPSFSYNPGHSLCFGNGPSQYCNYLKIPSDWK